MFLTTNGNVYVCGNNNYGQLGLGCLYKTCEPIKVEFTQPIQNIYGQANHSICLDINDEVFVCCEKKYTSRCPMGTSLDEPKGLI